MKIDEKLKKKLEIKAQETVDKLNKYFKFNMKVPEIYYDVTGTNAGIAKSETMSVHLNPALLLQNIKETIDNTLPHEICHIAIFHKSILENKEKFPDGHGAQWKFMMYVVGAAAKRCHDYDVTDVKRNVTEYTYFCKCEKPVLVNRKIHNQIQKGSKYQCKKCNEIITGGERVMKFGFSRPSPNGTTLVREN